MPKVKIYNNGYILDINRLNLFIQRIDKLISTAEMQDLEIDELVEFKKKVISEQMYCNKDEWFITDMEERLVKCVEKYKNDLSFF